MIRPALGAAASRLMHSGDIPEDFGVDSAHPYLQQRGRERSADHASRRIARALKSSMRKTP